MPVSVEEYQIGQLYAFSVESLNNTGGGDGIQVIKSESFSNVPLLKGKPMSGQYTYKIYHMTSKAPEFIQMLMPKGSLEFHEESWNAYPYCKTIVTNPRFMKEDFHLTIESIHRADGGDSENIMGLSPDKLKIREVCHIDIAKDRIASADYKANYDPCQFKSLKTGRGALKESWQQKVDPLMTCYKLVTVEFKWFGLQNRVENSIMSTEKRVFTLFHRQIFCLIDEWFGLTMEDIRQFEAKVNAKLEKQRNQGELRGMKATE